MKPLPAGYSGPTITSQPESWVGVMGEQPEIRLEAEGQGELTYKWYYRDVGNTKFSLSSDIDDCYDSYPLTKVRDGREVYCVATDIYGVSVRSEIATMSRAD